MPLYSKEERNHIEKVKGTNAQTVYSQVGIYLASILTDKDYDNAGQRLRSDRGYVNGQKTLGSDGYGNYVTSGIRKVMYKNHEGMDSYKHVVDVVLHYRDNYDETLYGVDLMINPKMIETLHPKRDGLILLPKSGVMTHGETLSAHMFIALPILGALAPGDENITNIH